MLYDLQLTKKRGWGVKVYAKKNKGNLNKNPFKHNVPKIAKNNKIRVKENLMISVVDV